MCGIYKITNKVNNKCYVGQAIDIDARWKKHRAVAFNPNDSCYNYPLYRAIRKYGLDSFIFQIIEECTPDMLNDKEIFYIAKYDSYENGYNQTRGGHDHSDQYKLTTTDVNKIIERLKNTFDTANIICNDFGVSATTIRDINRGDKYRRDDETYPIRPKLQTLQTQKYFCESCGKDIAYGSKLCNECYYQSIRKIKRPEPLELAKMIKEIGFTKTGKCFGVSGNTIKKWCKN